MKSSQHYADQIRLLSRLTNYHMRYLSSQCHCVITRKIKNLNLKKNLVKIRFSGILLYCYF